MPTYTTRIKPNPLSFLTRFLRGFNPKWKDANFMWRDANFSWTFMSPMEFTSRLKPNIPNYFGRNKPSTPTYSGRIKPTTPTYTNRIKPI